MKILEFEHWCRQQQLPTLTIDLIAAIRSSPPSRRVQGRTKNVSGVYPSRKMGQTIQFESHTVELWAIYHMEHDPKVLEFYDQPPPFKIQYKNKTGRNIGHYHTPDFFVLRNDGACWEEWKTVRELENETVRTLIDAASPVNLKEANRKFNIVQAYFQRHIDIYKDITPRTLRRWVQQFREAEANYGCGYVGLLARTNKQGNRQQKAPTDSSELLDKFIREHFETPRQSPAASVYRAYARACTALNIQPLSNRTFYQRLKRRPTHEQTLNRQGAKAAYATEPFVWELTLNTRPHGNRPHEIVHIDHTELDIELRSQATGRLLGRPWLTLLTDAYSRRILAVYLTFDAPSYRSCMMGLRIFSKPKSFSQWRSPINSYV